MIWRSASFIPDVYNVPSYIRCTLQIALKRPQEKAKQMVSSPQGNLSSWCWTSDFRFLSFSARRNSPSPATPGATRRPPAATRPFSSTTPRFDAHKLDISDEFQQVMEARPVRVVLGAKRSGNKSLAQQKALVLRQSSSPKSVETAFLSATGMAVMYF